MPGKDIHEENNNSIPTKTSATSDKSAGSHNGTVWEELEQLSEALLNDEELYIDENGVIHSKHDSSGISTLNTSNMTKINSDPFALPIK